MTILEQLLTVADQDLKTTVVVVGGGGGGGGGAIIQTPRCGGQKSQKNIFRPFRPQVWSKNKGGGSRGPGSLPWIRQWLRSFPYESEQMSAGQSKNEMSSQSKLQINKRGGGGMQQPSTYLKPTSFPGPLPLPFFNGQGLARERG